MQMGFIVFSFVAFSLCCVLWNVEGTSMPLCPENCDNFQCSTVPNCQCGSYKGWCGCCSYCYKCPGEICHRLGLNRCAPGSKCMKGADVPGICQMS
ncbi:Serine protease HTR4 like protein [Argiope bruennichi]|uniref:Serine protease HTR4 like protein n=1 Tax=Argiope bruennichi TaxID=94029 RepID=A0A8T0FN67_ARGBR|nr:Serine protease HTR4 like protein [Argiope bruennichi]